MVLALQIILAVCFVGIGGMLLSGRKVAELVIAKLKK